MMQQIKQINILDMMKMYGEDSCKSVLSTFMCPLNLDVEDFIHNKAVEFARQRIAVTFLVFKETESSSALVGYYTLANKFVSIAGANLSKTLQKKIAKFSQYDDSLDRFMVSMPLIAQLGRNFNPNLPFSIAGADLLSMALQRVLDIEYLIGGKTVYIECNNQPKLFDFYSAAGFLSFDKRSSETPPYRTVKVIWHTGESGTGKTHTYLELVEIHGEDSVYLMSDYNIGGLDLYMGEQILFMDEYKGELKYQLLLDFLEGYKKQLHCRYANACALWTEVHITSIYPPDEIYDLMMPNVNRRRDSIDQLMKRIDTIIYHYKNKDNEYCQYEMPAQQYKNYDDLRLQAANNMNKSVTLN